MIYDVSQTTRQQRIL